jgi:hypothetical protein
VDATVCAGVGVSTLLAFIDPLRRAGCFAFAATFPLGGLGVWGDGAEIPGVAACGVGVEAVGIGDGAGVDTAACACDGFFLCAGCKGWACGGRDTGPEAGGAVGGTGCANGVVVAAEGGCGGGCAAEGTPPGVIV